MWNSIIDMQPRDKERVVVWNELSEQATIANWHKTTGAGWEHSGYFYIEISGNHHPVPALFWISLPAERPHKHNINPLVLRGD